MALREIVAAVVVIRSVSRGIPDEGREVSSTGIAVAAAVLSGRVN